MFPSFDNFVATLWEGTSAPKPRVPRSTAQNWWYYPSSYSPLRNKDSPMTEWTVHFKLGLGDGPDDPSGLSLRTAYVYLRTSKLPELMKEGLFLSQENIKERESYYKRDQVSREEFKYIHTRWYSLVGPDWTGVLYVQASTLKPVTDFRISQLCHERVLLAQVDNQRRQPVYFWDRDRPQISFNMLYDDMPLKGLWPWPKEDNDGRSKEIGGEMPKGGGGERPEKVENERLKEDGDAWPEENNDERPEEGEDEWPEDEWSEEDPMAHDV